MKEERRVQKKRRRDYSRNRGKRRRGRGRESLVLKGILFFPALINNLRNRREGGNSDCRTRGILDGVGKVYLSDEEKMRRKAR